MNANELTLGQIREIMNMFQPHKDESRTLNVMIDREVIIRTESSGVWFGRLQKKAGREVVLGDARRMWLWWSAKSISLSGVAIYGINQERSRIAPALEEVWLEAIEILPCSEGAADSIRDAPDAEAT